MVCAPVRSIIPALKLGDCLSVHAHKPWSISYLFAKRRPVRVSQHIYIVFHNRISIKCLAFINGRAADQIVAINLVFPVRVAQSVRHLTRKSEVLGSIPGLATYFRFSFRCTKRGSCQFLAKVCARSTGCLPRKSVVSLTDRPDMTLDVYRGCK